MISRAASGFRLELFANLFGTGWSALVQLLCVPLYIRILGIEAYALIGFYLMLQAIFGALDLGLSPTINREMARHLVQSEKGHSASDLLRTLESGYWFIGLLLGIVVYAAAPWIARDWVKASAIPLADVQRSVMIMGLLVVFQWPVSFYQGGLMGLRRQASFNIVKVVAITLMNGGGVLALLLLSRNIKVLLLWQVGVSAAQSLVLASLLWRNMPRSRKDSRFDRSLVTGVWRFAAGMTGITLMGLLLSQIDKLLVSKLFSLKVFGYYTIAWTVANGLLVISAALFNVIFPRMSSQVAMQDEKGIRRSYHGGSQLMAVLVFPFAAVLSVFSLDILRIWTRSSEVALAAQPILMFLVVGCALNAVLYLPYALQLAFGWTRLSLIAGISSIGVVVPAILTMTHYFGPLGAASAWGLLNILNLVIVVPIMHRRLLRGEMWNYFADIGLPFLAATATSILGHVAFKAVASSAAIAAAAFCVWLGAVVAAAVTTSYGRAWILHRVSEIGSGPRTPLESLG